MAPSFAFELNPQLEENFEEISTKFNETFNEHLLISSVQSKTLIELTQERKSKYIVDNVEPNPCI